MIEIDLKSDVPIYLQLRNQIVLAIARGELAFGDALPTVRQLAQDMGVNPMTVSKAYKELKNQGYIESNIRQGTVIRKTEIPQNAISKIRGELELLLAEASIGGCREEEIVALIREILERYRR